MFKSTPPCGHTEFVDKCVRCYHWQHTEEYRVKNGGPKHLPTKSQNKKNVQSYPACKFLGDKLQKEAECGTCGGGKAKIPLYSCSIYGECNTNQYRQAEIREKDEYGNESLLYVKSCKGCKEFIQKISINQGAWGLGDSVQGLLAVAGYKQENPNKYIVYKVGPKGKPFVDLFTGYDELQLGEWDKGNTIPLDDSIDLQLNKNYKDDFYGKELRPRWERYRENIKCKVSKIPELKEHDKILNLQTTYKGYVVLCPFSQGSDREYSVHNWLTLETELNNCGYKTLILHNEADICKPFKSIKITNASPEEVISILLNSTAAIGCDSGLSHLAGILKIPTIVLCGQVKGANIYGCYPNAVCIQGKLNCDGCQWTKEWTQKCRPYCPSMQMITSNEIINEIDKIYLHNLTRDKTLVSVERLAGIRKAVLETNHLDGDTAELGVYVGGSSKIINTYSTHGKHHLFDTFEGIPEDDTFGEHKKGDFPSNAQEVLIYLNNENNICHVGFFPDSTKDIDTNIKYRFVHIDGDTFQTTLAAIKYFTPKMCEGGIMLFDDFEWWRCPGVAKALYESFNNVEKSAEHQAIIRCTKSISLPIV